VNSTAVLDTPIDILWESKYKPTILSYKKVPLELVGEVLGIHTDTVRRRAYEGMYDDFAQVIQPTKLRKGDVEVYPLRFIAWYEGRTPQVRR